MPGDHPVSRGLGRIQLAILAEIESAKQAAIATARVQRSDVNESSVHVTAWSVAYRCFAPSPLKWGWRPSPAQIKACTRAMHSFIRKFPQYALTSRRSRKGIVLYEITDRVSVLWAEMRMETRGNPLSRSEARAALEKQNRKEDDI